MSKKLFLFIAALTFTFSINTGCDKNSDLTPEDSDVIIENEEDFNDTIDDILDDNDGDHEDDGDYTWDPSSVINISLNGNSITVDGQGATVSESIVTITSAGVYSIAGTLNDGQIIVDAADETVIKLIFNSINVNCSYSAPVNIINADKVIIILKEGSQNVLTDPATYVFEDPEDDEPNAALFSKTDLSIFGTGTLSVNGKYNDGITSKDGLIIKSGTINVTSVDDGIRGKDYLIVRDGNITVNAAGDGFKSDNDSKATRGYIYIEKGTINITSGGDAISAETDVMIKDGEFNINSGGGSSYTVSGDLSAKGIKGLIKTVIDGGNFTISSADDAVHSNGAMVINDGTFNISSGDDGMHADSTLGVNGGIITITKCYEGIESMNILIGDGNIHITASDDGINGAGGNDGSGGGGWPGGMPPAGNYHLYITGGYIYVNANGDGLDVNGSIDMTGGTVIVNGPTASDNGAIDYDVAFKLTGGYLLAVGSSGMAMATSTTSTQNSLLLNLSQSKSAGTLVHIQNNSGEDIMTFSPAKTYQSIAFSSSKLVTGTTYQVYLGGTSTGISSDGLYQDGTYSGGTLYTTFTISSVVTKIGNTGTVPH